MYITKDAEAEVLFVDADCFALAERTLEQIGTGAYRVIAMQPAGSRGWERPAEVESALYGHPGVAECAVIGVPDDRWGEAVKAIVVRRSDADLAEQELMAYARQHIAGYKAPKSVDVVDVLPRNASGKLLKTVLRKPYWEGRDRQVN